MINNKNDYNDNNNIDYNNHNNVINEMNIISQNSIDNVNKRTGRLTLAPC